MKSTKKSSRKKKYVAMTEDAYGAVATIVVEPTEIDRPSTAKQRRWLPQREQVMQSLPFVLLFIIGAILRFVALGEKPLHHDESLHAYYALQLMHNMENYASCLAPTSICYKYDPLLHGPFQFHIIALVYKLSQWLGAAENGVNTTTVRIAAASLGSLTVFLPYFLRHYLGRYGALLASFLLMISPSMVYFSRFAREDAYMAFFTMLLVVAMANYVHKRRGLWLVIAAIAFSFSYATKEATFLLMAVFGSFFIVLFAWELGVKTPVRERFHPKSFWGKYAPKSAAPLMLVGLAVLGLPVIPWFFSWMKELSVYITTNTSNADVFVQNLKSQTIALLPWIGAALTIYVVAMQVWSWLRKRNETQQRRGLAVYVDPMRQPLLNTLVTMPRWHWFSAIVAGVTVFVVLFSVLFTNMPRGLGDGIWQGLYYWLQQQHVARGSQPWFYYLLLIPLYEQVGIVFGLFGIVRCLLRPTRFRLFLVYWFLGNVLIYSWAGEKMPWLMIHMTMPLMLLAALGLEPAVLKCIQFIKSWRTSTIHRSYQVQSTQEHVMRGASLASVVLCGLLLLPTLQNMFQVSFVHAADAPHEMMVYVQTTTDINIVMGKVEALDKKLHGGTHKLPIAVTADAAWPFYWYLRDYKDVCYGFPTGCASAEPAVIITGGDNLRKNQEKYAEGSSDGEKSAYLYHQYRLRTWWDESYKPRPCVPTTTESCEGRATWGGIGPMLWLSYGSHLPSDDAQFDAGRAINNVWQWWWYRKAIGSTNGSTDMGFFIRRDLGVKP